MAFNIYGEPIPDVVTLQPSAAPPQRADGKTCNIFGEPIENSEAVAEKIRQLPPTLRHVQFVQGAANATFLTLGPLARYLADVGTTTPEEYDNSEDGWRNGPAGHGLYSGDIRIDDDE